MIPHGGNVTPEIILQTVYDLISAADAVTLPMDVAWVAEYHDHADCIDLAAEPMENAAALGGTALQYATHQGQAELVDLFALLLLAPPAVLDGYAVRTPQDVQRLTGLDEEHSRTAYGYLTEHRRKQRIAAIMADMTERADQQMCERHRHYQRNGFG